MSIKISIRESLKNLLKFSKTNPELLLGFVAGVLLVILSFMVLLWRVSYLSHQVESLNQQLTEKQVAEAESVFPLIYEVQAGDSSWEIAQAFYGCGEAYVAIEEANNLEHDSLLEIGQQLRLMDNEGCRMEDEKSFGPAQDEQRIEIENLTHEVVAGDCLWSVALEELGNPYLWPQVYELNREKIGDDPHLIYPGTMMQLPMRNSQ